MGKVSGRAACHWEPDESGWGVEASGIYHQGTGCWKGARCHCPALSGEPWALVRKASRGGSSRHVLWLKATILVVPFLICCPRNPFLVLLLFCPGSQVAIFPVSQAPGSAGSGWIWPVEGLGKRGQVRGREAGVFCLHWRSSKQWDFSRAPGSWWAECPVPDAHGDPLCAQITPAPPPASFLPVAHSFSAKPPSRFLLFWLNSGYPPVLRTSQEDRRIPEAPQG